MQKILAVSVATIALAVPFVAGVWLAPPDEKDLRVEQATVSAVHTDHMGRMGAVTLLTDSGHQLQCGANGKPKKIDRCPYMTLAPLAGTGTKLTVKHYDWRILQVNRGDAVLYDDRATYGFWWSLEFLYLLAMCALIAGASVRHAFFKTPRQVDPGNAR